MSNPKSNKIEEEMLNHAVAVISYVTTHNVPRSVADQVIRSVTSIGANYAEAQDASSQKDFTNKIYIAKKEESETRYWLKLCAKLQGTDSALDKLLDITQKFIMTLQKILKSMKQQSLKGNS